MCKTNRYENHIVTIENVRNNDIIEQDIPNLWISNTINDSILFVPNIISIEILPCSFRYLTSLFNDE